jgi:FAD:protein FMN transferase
LFLNNQLILSNLKAAAKSLAAFSVILIASCQSKKEPEKNSENLTESNSSPDQITESKTDLKKFSFAQPHLGTTVQLVFYTHDDLLATKLSQKCFQRVRDLNAIFSDYIDLSELSKLCKLPINHAHPVSNPLFTVIAQAQEISAKTNGAFDITIGKYTKRWRERSTQKSTQPEEELDLVNYQHLKLDPVNQTITLLKPVQLDLGGIAKGYIADQLMLIIKDAGISQAAVIIGGETVLADPPPGKDGWRIGIEDTEHKISGTLTLANTCLSTSGDSYQFYQQDGQRKSHLIDPTTKKSKTNRLNVTTIAPTAMQADATALRILPTEKSLPLANQQPHLQALFIPHQEAPLKTNNFPAISETE